MEEGVRIYQRGDDYLAKSWRLGPSVVEAIDTALRHGLTALLQNGHPQASKRGKQGDGAVYISFARAENEYWVMTLNERSPSNPKRRWDVTSVLINKTYRHVLKEAGILFAIEPFRNASNVMVAVEHLDSALRACVRFADAHAVRSGRRGLTGVYPGFRDEADIERWLMENLGKAQLGRSVDIIGRQVQVEAGIIDILLRDSTTGGLIILEVKQGRAQRRDVESQLARYVNSPMIRNQALGKPIVGCLIAEAVPQAVREAAANSPVPMMAFEIVWTSVGQVELKPVVGTSLIGRAEVG